MTEPINRSDPGDMPRYKVTNAAAEEWIKNRARLLCAMWEDGNLEAWEDAEALARWIEENAPGAFVLINTDDCVTPRDCGTDYPGQENAHGDHGDCWYYYPDYRLFLMARTEWENVKWQCQSMWDAHQAEHQCRLRTAVGVRTAPDAQEPR